MGTCVLGEKPQNSYESSIYQQFLRLCDEYGITVYYSKVSKPAHIERFNRTLQSLIYRYCTERQTFRYCDKLQHFISTYNNRKHRMINVRFRQIKCKTQ